MIWRHKWWNLFRCFIIPLLYTSYIIQTIVSSTVLDPFSLSSHMAADAMQNFYKDQGDRGAGHIAPLSTLPSDLLNSKLVVYDPTGAGASLLNSALASAGVSPDVAIETIQDTNDIILACSSNLNGRSNCFGAVFFDAVDAQSGELVSASDRVKARGEKGEEGRPRVEADCIRTTPSAETLASTSSTSTIGTRTTLCAAFSRSNGPSTR